MKNMIPKAIQTVTKQLTLKLTLAAVGLTLASGAQAQTMLVKVLQESDEIISQVYKEVPIKSCRVEQMDEQTLKLVVNKPPLPTLWPALSLVAYWATQLEAVRVKMQPHCLEPIAGADIANKKGKSKQVIVGHKQQEVCDVVMQQRSVSQVTGYKTYIEFGGNVWQMTTTIPYTTGEFLSVNVDITPAE